jgi:hypothetical protein
MDNMFFMTRAEIKIEGKDVPIWFYKSFICAFDRHRFYKPDEIYSSLTVGGCKPLGFINVEEDAILNSEHVEEWEKFDRYITTFYSNILGKDPFFKWW